MGGAFISATILMLALPAAVQAQLNYTTTNGTITITITDYTGTGGAVSIPSTINGLPVTRIGAWAFDNCTNLTSVTFPNSVTSIGNCAFFVCTRLTTVTIPKNITSIGGEAFGACTSLDTIVVSSVSWLHTTSRSNGNGTVSFIVDANPSTGTRSGTITVGEEAFPVTQTGPGWISHNAFGSMWDAGSGWYGGSPYGWMWFQPGGQWIWSTGLQGWLAVTDANSRQLWSTQFRWLTPSASDPYQADTTAIGTIYVGKYQGNTISDGWVVSDRFGYVWANGDGQWFYSSTYGWLGVTPEGGIWCVNLGRFL